MRLLKMQCPYCGAALEVDVDGAAVYCQYCGSKLLIDDEAVNINVNYRDEAKTIEAEMKRSQYDIRQSRYAAEDAEYEEKYSKWKARFEIFKKIQLIGWSIFLVAYLITRVITSLGDNAFITGIATFFAVIAVIPYLLATLSLIFVGPYLYYTNPKRKHSLVLQKREIDEENRMNLERVYELEKERQEIQRLKIERSHELKLQRQERFFNGISNVVDRLSGKK